MSDINAAPSSTEPAVIGSGTQDDTAAIQARIDAGLTPLPQEAGRATVGESLAISTSLDPMGNVTDSTWSAAMTMPPPAVATATSASNVVASSDADTVAADDPNAAASPAAGQSASGTASSAQGALQDAGTNYLLRATKVTEENGQTSVSLCLVPVN
ncbi:hypothetical protein JFN94_25960 [Burkholderia anthina]|uniref:Uncharacterized protein n=1 Tax=Burkholderia anthina TaxID=179879 RepID=A0A7T6VIX1_9BURK|nr:hypothetical protein [Burkholderia anthina]QQK04777.1 hypothetical protein JFN94_25960 [Burkholderia anthina]